MKISTHYLYFFVIVLICLAFIYLSLPEKNKNDNPTPTEEEVTLEETTTEVVVDETTEDQNCHESCEKNLLFNLTLYVFAFAVSYRCIVTTITFMYPGVRNFLGQYHYSIEVILFTFPLVLSIFSLWKNSLCLIQIGIFIFYLVIFCFILTSNYHLYKKKKQEERDDAIWSFSSFSESQRSSISSQNSD